MTDTLPVLVLGRSPVDQAAPGASPVRLPLSTRRPSATLVNSTVTGCVAPAGVTMRTPQSPLQLADAKPELPASGVKLAARMVFCSGPPKPLVARVTKMYAVLVAGLPPTVKLTWRSNR